MLQQKVSIPTALPKVRTRIDHSKIWTTDKCKYLFKAFIRISLAHQTGSLMPKEVRQPLDFGVL